MAKASGIRNSLSAYCMLLCAVSMIVFTGCPGGQDLGPTGTVSGTLLYNDKPVAPHTAVVFKELAAGHTCMGETDAEGKYTLNSWNEGELPVGTYSVMIRPPTTDPEEVDPEAMMENPELADGGEPVFDFPEKYGQIATSGLSFVVDEGENTHDINLKD